MITRFYFLNLRHKVLFLKPETLSVEVKSLQALVVSHFATEQNNPSTSALPTDKGLNGLADATIKNFEKVVQDIHNKVDRHEDT